MESVQFHGCHTEHFSLGKILSFLNGLHMDQSYGHFSVDTSGTVGYISICSVTLEQLFGITLGYMVEVS